MKLEEKVLQILEQYCADALESGILVALSGGADSCALALLLKNLSGKITEKHNNFRFCCAHFNHCIRGDAADEDETFVEAFCKRQSLVLMKDRADVPAYAEKNGFSIETAARILRYSFLERAMLSSGLGYIATAHHLSDNAESILLHFLRGSGLNGICGMQYCSEKKIRPLLDCDKFELVEYLRQNGEEFRTDATNYIPNTARNCLRLQVIPEIRRGINPNCEKVLCRNARLLSEDEKFLTEIAKKAYAEAKLEDGVDADRLAALPNPVKSRALLQMLHENGVHSDIFQPHVEALMQLLEKQSGARVELPQVSVRNRFGRLIVEKKVVNSAKNDFSTEEYAIPLPPNGEKVKMPFGSVRASVLPYDSNGSAAFGKTRAVMDFEKLMSLFEAENSDLPSAECENARCLTVRFRRAGDMFFPVNAPGRVKLKKYLIAQKIDSALRDRLPLLECGGKIVYVYGIGICDDVKISNETKHIVCIEFDIEDAFFEA